MSRYSELDLDALEQPTAVVGLDYNAILTARLVELEAQLSVRFDAVKCADIMALARNIAASPMRYLTEAAATRELYMSNRINAAIRSIFLATAHGSDLDQIGANRAVARRVADKSDPKNIIMEEDASFRARIQLVMESYSPHGTSGSYVYWALDADDQVSDVVAYGPDHKVLPPILPAHAKLVVLSSSGDGTASSKLLAAVFKNCTPDKRRPVGDKLEVVSARPVKYDIEADLYVASPNSASLILEAAKLAGAHFISNRLRIGRKLYRTSLAAALNVNGVADVVIKSPSADLDIGAFEAPYCTNINLILKPIDAGWRNV